MEKQSFIERYGEYCAPSLPSQPTLTSILFFLPPAGFGDFPSPSRSSPRTDPLSSQATSSGHTSMQTVRSRPWGRLTPTPSNPLSTPLLELPPRLDLTPKSLTSLIRPFFPRTAVPQAAMQKKKAKRRSLFFLSSLLARALASAP
jgi:hypothetical protein